MGADGSGLAQITALPDPVSSAPGWSPDGSRIAFAAGGKIYLVSPDGTALVELAPFGRTSTMPSWSPDGRRIAFISSSQGPLQFGYSLAVMDAEGSAASVLFANDDLVLDPTWSPDGGHIAFTANDRATGIFDVYSVKADGTGLVDVSGGRSYDAGPSWGRR